MSIRSSVNFSQKIAPLVKKYGNSYGVKNTCSLGVILVDRLRSDLREDLMTLVGGDTDLIHIHIALDKAEAQAASDTAVLAKKVRRLKRERQQELDREHSTTTQKTPK